MKTGHGINVNNCWGCTNISQPTVDVTLNDSCMPEDLRRHEDHMASLLLQQYGPQVCPQNEIVDIDIDYVWIC